MAIVAVRALAIGRGVLRYAERLVSHDAVLRMLTDLRARVFATLRGPPRRRAPPGDVLSRLVSDVEAVQDLLLRVLVPGRRRPGRRAGGRSVAVLSPRRPPVRSPPGCWSPVWRCPPWRPRSPAAARPGGPARGALAVDALDLTHGAPTWPRSGPPTPRCAPPSSAAAGWPGWNVGRPPRVRGGRGGVLTAGVTAAAVVLAALAADVPGVLVGVLAVGTLAAVEVTLALVGRGPAVDATAARPGPGRRPARRRPPTPPARTARPS